jgi:hypothetical protein
MELREISFDYDRTKHSNQHFIFQKRIVIFLFCFEYTKKDEWSSRRMHLSYANNQRNNSRPSLSLFSVNNDAHPIGGPEKRSINNSFSQKETS